MNKQTQTKMFDFSDPDLDFCAGSRAKFPDVFKKMLATGFNNKVVSSVTVSSDQVTLDYGVSHGYVANRVLAINTSGLAGEFYIDSVTTNTVTLTASSAPPSIAGGFTTKVASLGWELVYEQAHIHIYKFKHIDDTDMYARFCFQSVMTSGNRNCIAIGIGRTVDLSLGIITDANCLEDLATCTTVANATSNLRWDFTNSTAVTFNNYTYAQGLSTFGKGVVVGSPYHLITMFNQAPSNAYGAVAGILPFFSAYEILNYPLLLAMDNGASTTGSGQGLVYTRSYVGKNRCTFTADNSSIPLVQNIASLSYLPLNIDNFNTTTCQPLSVYTHTEKQALGFVCGGLYQAFYGSSPASMSFFGTANSPSLASDIDFENTVARHHLTTSITTSAAWLVASVEEVKIV